MLILFSIKTKYYEDFHEKRERGIDYIKTTCCFACVDHMKSLVWTCVVYMKNPWISPAAWRPRRSFINPSGTRLRWHADPTLPATFAALYWKIALLHYDNRNHLSPALSWLEYSTMCTMCSLPVCSLMLPMSILCPKPHALLCYRCLLELLLLKWHYAALRQL